MYRNFYINNIEIFRALKAGMKAPLIVTVPHKIYPQAEVVSALNALHELYVPLNIREENNKKKADAVGLLGIEYKSEVSFRKLRTRKLSARIGVLS